MQSLRRDDYDRPVMLDCDKDGTITYRAKADRLPDGSLPFFSVHTPAEAEALIIRLCKLQYVPHPRTRGAWYRIVNLGGDQPELEIDDMDLLADLFRTTWFDMKERAELARRQA